MALTKVIGSGIGTVTNQFADANMSAGSVIQIVTNTYSTLTATTSSSFVDTGLAATITPSSTSSKIFVLAACSMWQNTAGGVSSITLYRGGSRVSDSATYGYAYGYGGGSNHVNHHTPTYLDSPNTTSATEYKIYFSAVGLGGTLSICPNSTPSTLTLIEIAG
tara:strand:+ start:1742 stop:2230 length:489 start_codon:yes stop_codon:yes gene_type:complete